MGKKTSCHKTGGEWVGSEKTPWGGGFGNIRKNLKRGREKGDRGGKKIKQSINPTWKKGWKTLGGTQKGKRMLPKKRSNKKKAAQTRGTLLVFHTAAGTKKRGKKKQSSLRPTKTKNNGKGEREKE